MFYKLAEKFSGNNKVGLFRAGEMNQCFRVFIAFPEDSGLISSMMSHNHP